MELDEILGLRTDFRRFIIHRLGDGRDTSLWFDNWCNLGPLSNIFSSREMANLELSRDLKVADLMVNDSWAWPEGMVIKCPALANFKPQLTPSIRDKVVWHAINGIDFGFKSDVVWECIRPVKPKVCWGSLIWFSNCVPKHAFILWLAIKRRLTTQDQLLNWQTVGDVKCGFCELQPDSVDHLFFGCNFNTLILSHFQARGWCLINTSNWDRCIRSAVKNWKGKSICAIVNKILFAAMIYVIWRERNLRLFQKLKRPV